MMHLHWAAIAPCLVPPAHVRAASADEQAAWYVVMHSLLKQGACPCPVPGGGGSRNVRRHDNRPAPIPEDTGSVVVCVSSMTTGRAEEHGLRTTRGFIDDAALPTGAAAVARVHQDHTHPGSQRLVGNLGAQIGIGPAIMHPPLDLSSSYPPLEVCQVFECYSLSRRFGFGNDMFANDVVDIALHPLLFVGAFAAQLARTGRALPVELERAGGPTAEDRERVRCCVDDLIAHGDELLYRSQRKGDSARLFVQAVDALAVLAFAPRGVLAFGQRWEGKGSA